LQAVLCLLKNEGKEIYSDISARLLEELNILGGKN
jgi:hypothetical protein